MRTITVRISVILTAINSASAVTTPRRRHKAVSQRRAGQVPIHGVWRSAPPRKVAMLRGSCLCGGIRYEISGKLYAALNCHCSMCRKAQGTAFRSRAKVRSADFCWIAGEHLLIFFESSPGNRRGFCRVCGSPMLTKFDADSSVFGLPLGALDDDPGIRTEMHVYVASKAPWFTISDDLPQFAELPK